MLAGATGPVIASALNTPVTALHSVRIERGHAAGFSPIRRSLLALSALPMLGPVWAYAAGPAAKVAAARVWPASEYTRVTFEGPSAFQYQHFFVKNPERLVLDLDGIEWSEALKTLASKVGADDPFIQSVRVGINRPNVIRVVLELKTEVLPQVFAVLPAGEFGHRLMLDIYPAKPSDPLLALFNEDVAQFGQGQGALPLESGREPGKVSKPVEPPKDAGKEAAKDASPPPADKPSAQTPPPKGAPAIVAGKKPARPFVVMLDPGHGGEDPGAIGRKGTREKDIVLVIARRLKEKLDGDSRFRIALTRDADFFVPLHHRVQRARRIKADLFVSVHADAFIQPQANGSSVFALSERGATSTAARWLANRENEADLIGGVNLNVRDTNLARVLLDLSTTAQINDSLKAGRFMLAELSEINRLHKIQVEQAGFAVLKAPDIPSILVETAFISNPDEERKLRDPAFQSRMADALADGIRTYFSKNPALARA